MVPRCCVLLLLAACINAAPVANPSQDNELDKELAHAVDLNELEKEIAGIPAAKHAVEVKNFESHVYVSKNGKIQEITQKEDQVANAADEVVADLKKTVVKTQEGPESKPVTHVETEVHVPSEGIHHVAVSEEKKSAAAVDATESQSQITCDDLLEFLSVNGRQLNVEDVARFVVESEDFVGFERLVFTMVAMKCMTQREADDFREVVYEKIDEWKQETEEEQLESEYEQLMDELLSEEAALVEEDEEEPEAIEEEDEDEDEKKNTLETVIDSILEDLNEETEEGDNSAERTIKQLSQTLKKERDEGNLSPDTEREIFETVAARVVPVVLAREQPNEATKGRKFPAQSESSMRGFKNAH